MIVWLRARCRKRATILLTCKLGHTWCCAVPSRTSLLHLCPCLGLHQITTSGRVSHTTRTGVPDVDGAIEAVLLLSGSAQGIWTQVMSSRWKAAVDVLWRKS